MFRKINTYESVSRKIADGLRSGEVVLPAEMEKAEYRIPAEFVVSLTNELRANRRLTLRLSIASLIMLLGLVLPGLWEIVQSDVVPFVASIAIILALMGAVVISRIIGEERRMERLLKRMRLHVDGGSFPNRISEEVSLAGSRGQGGQSVRAV